MKRPGVDLFAIVGSLPDAVLALGPDGRIRYASPRVRQMLGCEPDRLQEQTLLDLVHPDDGPSVGLMLAKGLGTSDAQAIDCRLRHTDGTWRRVELRLRVDERDGIVGLAVDRGAAAETPVPPGRLAYDLAHHLSAILGCTELLLADLPATDPYREDLEGVQRSARSALVLASQLETGRKEGRGGS